MPNKNQLNKEKIDHKLAELTFHANEDVWSDFLEYHKSSKKKNSGVSFKFEAKFLLFPLGLVVVSSIVYLSVTSIKSQNITTNSFIDKKDEIVEQKLIEEVIKAPEKPKKIISKPIVLDTLVSDSTAIDSTLTNKEYNDSVAKTVVANENNVNESEKKNKESKAEVKKSDDDSVKHRRNNEENKKVKPKKKKRKNPAVSSESFNHHPEEDDIVISN